MADEPFFAPFFSPALPAHAAKIVHEFTQVKSLQATIILKLIV